MVKKCIYVILVVLISSCCYMGKKTIYGLPRKNITSLSRGEINYRDIDTTALYKLYIVYYYNKYKKQYFYYEKADDNPYPYISYLKFYSDGKLGLFVIPRKDTSNLTRDTFNPLKAKMGYYSNIDNVLHIKIITIGDCSLYINNEKGYINSDTVRMENKQHYGNIFIKKLVPREFLRDWSPDW